MANRDPYDPRVAFDDVYAGEEIVDYPVASTPSPVMLLCALMMVVSRIRARRLAPPEHDVTPAQLDTASFALPDQRIVKPAGLPLYDELLRRFERATPPQRIVRVDDERGYREFRNGRRAPYLRQLAARVEALEEALALHREQDMDYFDDLEERFGRHVADGHGGDPDVLGAEVVEAAEAAKSGGSRVRLTLPAWANGKIECWQDGPEILCTMRLVDGRFLTSGTLIEEHVNEVLGCCVGLGHDATRALAPTLSVRLAGESLLRQIAQAAPGVLRAAGGGTFVGMITPRRDSVKASIMALLQRCQRGDERAAREVRALEGAGAPVGDACDRLMRAQASKAAGRLS